MNSQFTWEEEIPKHLFILCIFSKSFWQEISCWLELCNIPTAILCIFAKSFWQEISCWLELCSIPTAIDLTNQINVMFGLFGISEHLC